MSAACEGGRIGIQYQLMEQLLPLIYLFFFLISGMLVGRTRLFSGGKIMRLVLSGALYALLFFMGFRLGRNGEIAANMTSIGFLSLSYAFVTAAGTVAILILFFIGAGRRRRKEKIPERSGYSSDGLPVWHHFRAPVRLFAAVLSGFLIGLIRFLAAGLTGENLTTWLLYLLLFLIGIELVRSGVNLKKVLAHPDTLLLPAGTVLGSLAGGLVLSPVLGIPAGKSLALASGFGWYSLSGVIITNLGDPVLGSAGFLSNMIRETIALLSIPLIARSPFPLIGIGVAGATSMDVTLPLIERTCGPAAVPASIASGAILSLLVPVLVPLFFQMG